MSGQVIGGRSLPQDVPREHGESGDCPECKGKGFLMGVCSCTEHGRRTANTPGCAFCKGDGFVHTKCWVCGGAGTRTGQVAATKRRQVEQDVDEKMHAILMARLQRRWS
jgi:hypothetical protein